MAHTQSHVHGGAGVQAGPGGTRGSERRLATVLGLAALYMVAELVGGLWTGSLALLADAGHMLADVGALGLGLFALWFARRPSGPSFTWGYYRTEILAALIHGATLIAIAIGIAFEAWGRLENPQPVQGAPVLAIATGGLLVNLAGLWILREDRAHNLNVRGAWLHVLTDALGSVGAMAAGAAIWIFGWNWVDPVASIAIAALVVHSAFALLREAVSVLMESAPGHLDVDRIRSHLCGLTCVAAIHDLHVWTITSGVVSLSCHAVRADGQDPASVLDEIRELLHDEFGIEHVTVQVESEAMETHEACD
ncbi:MAG: cation diffusion facilitator family transporter [Myxococcota bacterium]